MCYSPFFSSNQITFSPRFAEESHQHLGGNVGSERTKRKTKGEETEGRQASSEYGTSSDGRGLSEDHSQSSSLLAAVRPSLCVYTLNLSQVLSCHKASWQQQAVEPNAPEDTILYSICVGRAEAIVFGGMRSDNTMEDSSSAAESFAVPRKHRCDPPL
ncbi:hypothetical protein AB6A40_007288 [Gnathostoma spinigerum]|uniref:Uncharacterized protein n=1 Tax=Gnathostoma spinigerum TaxID=75299 RepID=A0ABD6EKT6_9BILA